MRLPSVSEGRMISLSYYRMRQFSVGDILLRKLCQMFRAFRAVRCAS